MKDRLDDRISRTDSFWDIDEMLPEKKGRLPFSSDTDTVEIPLNPPDNPKKPSGEEALPKPGDSDRLRIAREAMRNAEIKLRVQSAAAMHDKQTAKSEPIPERIPESAPSFDPDVPIFEYTPEGNPLFSKVSVRLWPARYSFYERFLSDARRYFDKSAPPCPPVPFFSYTPQYVQLSKEQLSYYLYWRDCVRHKEYPEADYAYILLYLYEILNLPDQIEPKDGAVLLCQVWRAYRKKYPKLDRILSEWLCDYCLIGQIAPPKDLYADFFGSVVENTSLKEFYIGYDTDSGSPFASALFAHGANYNFRNSKFITPENRELFEKHIQGAFLYAFSKAERENQTVFAPIGKKSMVTVYATRDAYAGALCAYKVKRRIALEYLSCSRSIELRYAVTDTIKYAENQVRGMLGIRSRFHTPNLAIPLKHAVDEYFAPLKRQLKKEAEPAPVPEYEKLYEAERSELSLAYAKELEEKAWETTSLLVEEEQEAEAPPNQSVFAPTFGVVSDFSAEKAENSPDIAAEPYIREALAALSDGNPTRFRQIASKNNLLPDALCEKINDRLFDLLGDTAVEESEDGFSIIEDYREDIEEWMKK